MQAQEFEITCPPWALPRESIPIHVKMDKTTTPRLGMITVSLPHELELKDTINMAEYTCQNGKLVIDDIEQSESTEYDYFGLVVATKDIPSDLQSPLDVGIEFQYKDNRVARQKIPVRVFRPQLEIDNMRDHVILSDNNTDIDLPIALKFSGFGDIVIRTECIIQGNIVSMGNTLAEEILHRINSEGFLDENTESDGAAIIDAEMVRGMAKELQDGIDGYKLGKNSLHETLVKDGIDVLCDLNTGQQQKIVKIWFNTVSGYLVKIISDIFNRNPSSRTRLESTTKIYTKINLPVTTATIRFTYSDLLGNTYPSIERKIEIIDKRKGKNHAMQVVEIPLVISDISEEDAFKNILALT